MRDKKLAPRAGCPEHGQACAGWHKCNILHENDSQTQIKISVLHGTT
jgi:hypothetical protein